MMSGAAHHSESDDYVWMTGTGHNLGRDCYRNCHQLGELSYKNTSSASKQSAHLKPGSRFGVITECRRLKHECKPVDTNVVCIEIRVDWCSISGQFTVSRWADEKWGIDWMILVH